MAFAMMMSIFLAAFLIETQFSNQTHVLVGRHGGLTKDLF